MVLTNSEGCGETVRILAGSPEPLLVGNVINTIFS